MEEEYIIAKLKELMPNEHCIPQGVLYSRLKTAVQQDLSKILSKLFKAERIRYSKTLNDILINIKDES